MYKQQPLAVSAAMCPEHVITHKLAPIPRIVYINLYLNLPSNKNQSNSQLYKKKKKDPAYLLQPNTVKRKT